MSMQNGTSSNVKLEKMRNLLTKYDVDAFMVDIYDAHISHIPSARDRRIAFITGFTGSAGTALITQEGAYFWTDGRYFVQSERQLENGWTLMKIGLPGTPLIGEFASSLGLKKIAFHSKATSEELVQTITKTLGKTSKLVGYEESFVDMVWGADQPEYQTKSLRIHDIKYAGKTTQEKLKELKQDMKSKKVDYLFVNQVDNCAWLLNLRGADMAYTVLFYAFILVSEEETIAFLFEENLTDEIKQYLDQAGVTVKHFNDTSNFMKKLAANMGDKVISLDVKVSNFFHTLFDDDNKLVEQNPITLTKSIKNQSEINGVINAHVEDGMAQVKFFSWLENVTKDKSVFNMTEVDLANKIEYLRSQQKGHMVQVFPTISAIGVNASLPHYNYPKTEKDDISVKPMMYLLDGGAHYIDGTTDITRCVHLGTPSDYEKLAYSLVLKGHVSFANLIFPENVKAPQIDAFARQHLWKYGLDYYHGTGHGLGACLNCHEGPMKIDVKLWGSYIETNTVPGMIMTNEPGFYHAEEGFGVRIENTIVVKEVKTKYNYAGVKYFGFDTISYCPIDTDLLDLSVLSSEDIKWLNDYHQMVHDTLLPALQEEEKSKSVDNSEYIVWLKEKTKAVSSA